MKWLIRTGKTPPGKPEDGFMFEKIDLTYKDGEPELIDELKGKGYVEWVIHPNPADPLAKPFKLKGEAAERKYEIFCGGFLYYHDVEYKSIYSR